LTYKIYRPLHDNPELFKSVHLTADGTAIAWGDIDMAATTIERLAEESRNRQKSAACSPNLEHNSMIIG
jgi:hypothetical protein